MAVWTDINPVKGVLLGILWSLGEMTLLASREFLRSIEFAKVAISSRFDRIGVIFVMRLLVDAMMHTRVNHLGRLRDQGVPLFRFAMPAQPNKIQWVQRLKDEGENVPMDWSVMQLRARWAELQAQKKGTQSDMQGRLQALKKVAHGRKGELIKHLKEMGLPVNEKRTIPELFQEGEKMIYQDYPPTGDERMGFGPHGHLTFQQAVAEDPTYVRNCLEQLATAKNPCWRMERFAMWADGEDPKGKKAGAVHYRMDVGEEKGTRSANVQGYAALPKSMPKVHTTSSPSASSVMSVSVVSDPYEAGLKAENEELKKQMQDLQAQLLELKEYLPIPRKDRKET